MDEKGPLTFMFLAYQRSTYGGVVVVEMEEGQSCRISRRPCQSVQAQTKVTVLGSFYVRISVKSLQHESRAVGCRTRTRGAKKLPTHQQWYGPLKNQAWAVVTS